MPTARQHRLDAKLLLIDDGGYGILREYQRDSYQGTHAVDLVQPDFLARVAEKLRDWSKERQLFVVVGGMVVVVVRIGTHGVGPDK